VFLAVLMLTMQQAGAPPPPQADVVIVGNRMREALEKCLARNCPPEEEADAAMNAGSESFMNGRYDEAGQILRRAISRNKRYAARMPGRVSDLYATYADVAQHHGNEAAFRRATLESVDVLRDELGQSHPAAIGASSRIGDMWVKLGNARAADDAYRAAAEAASRAGNVNKAAELTFRRAWIALAAGNHAEARRLLGQMERERGGEPRFASLLRVLRARIALAEGVPGAIDALVSAMPQTRRAAPVLVYAPPYPELDASTDSGMSASRGIDISGAQANTSLNRGGDLRWADIGFWVRGDGRAADIEILRPARGTEWAKALKKQIAERRYAATTDQSGDLGQYRVERFTLRTEIGLATGSRIVTRHGRPTLQVVDLTQLAMRDTGPPAAANP